MMPTLNWIKRGAGCIALALGVGCAPTEGEGAAVAAAGSTAVVLQTDWYAQPEHGGYYQALLTGLYAQAGLDVEIRPGANLSGIPQMVAMGRVHFAIGSSDSLLIAASRGIPLVAVFPHFQRNPQCIMAREEAGVDSLQSLNGKTVMVGAGMPYVEFLRRALGIKMHLVPLDFSLTRFLSDPTFIQQCFVTSEPYYVRRHGVQPVVLRLSDSGFNPYRLVYANADFVASRPAIVRAFIKASWRGWQGYLEGDGSVVHARIGELNPQHTPDSMAWTKNALAEERLAQGDARAGEALGRFQRQRFERQLAQLEAIGMLDGAVDLSSAVAAHLLPPGMAVGFDDAE